MTDVSVVVCTRDRCNSLLPTLESIATAIAAVPSAVVELVLVDNGSTDGTAALAEKWLKGQAFPSRLVIEKRPGVATARNSAIRVASGALLLFTDDDCRLEPRYISRALAIDRADVGMVLRGGRVELGDVTDLPISIRTGDAAQIWSKAARSAETSNIGIALIGASMMMRRELVDSIGFFDERFGPGGPFKGGEEIDFLYRTYAAGHTIAYEPTLVVFHHHGRKDLAEARRLATAYSRGDGALLAKFGLRSFVLKPLVWDIRKALHEVFAGTSTGTKSDFKPSYRRRLLELTIGAVEYWLYAMRPSRVGGRR